VIPFHNSKFCNSKDCLNRYNCPLYASSPIKERAQAEGKEINYFDRPDLMDCYRRETSRNRNYVPHNEYSRHESSDKEWEDYMHNLSIIVNRACDKFFKSRNMPINAVDHKFNDYKKRFRNNRPDKENSNRPD